jgi:hypothetical protein
MMLMFFSLDAGCAVGFGTRSGKRLAAPGSGRCADDVRRKRQWTRVYPLRQPTAQQTLPTFSASLLCRG